MWGALYYVVTGGRFASDAVITSEEYDRAHRAGEYLIGYVEQGYGRGWLPKRLVAWNDAPDRAEEQVVAVLRAAAADAGAEAGRRRGRRLAVAGWTAP